MLLRESPSYTITGGNRSPNKVPSKRILLAKTDITDAFSK